MRRLTLLFVVCALAVGARETGAQEKEDRTLLPWEQMRSIINEASGDRAMHHLLELVPYPRVRPLEEYRGHFRESEVMVRYAKAYGFSSVEIESFPQTQKLWQPTVAQLWMIEPQTRKLFDIYDVAVAVAANSASGDVTAEVVDVGNGGRAEDYAGRDVKGKIVLGTAGAATLQRLAVWERGALGVLSADTLRLAGEPDQIASQSMSATVGPTAPAGAQVGFGWSISQRVAQELGARLARGERVRLRSAISAETFPGEMEVVHATIAGDGTSTQDVVVSAHLYEGYLKQGANDDNSGCALTLEIGRAYIELVKRGQLPKPKRTIHFLWVPEISGTNAWLNAHKDLERRIIADLNFDMEGIRLSTSGSYWVLHRTPDTFPTFLNDVAQSLMEFVSELNRERVRYRGNGYAFTWPIVSPTGSRDPFYIKIDKHYGSSDHVTYMQHGIPSVMFITWPDMWYHSSQDTPDKQDPTQYKRAAVVGIGALSTLAAGGDTIAAEVTSETLGRGTARMGEAQRKGTAYLADAGNPMLLADAYKEARIAVRHQAVVEQAVIRSSAVLYDDPPAAAKTLAPLASLVEARAAALIAELRALYALRAAQFRVPVTEPTLTPAEQEASRLLVQRVETAAPGAGGGFGGFGGPNAAAQQRIPQHMRAELNLLLAQKKTALEIRDFLSGEFEPLPIDVLIETLRDMEGAGTATLTRVPAATQEK